MSAKLFIEGTFEQNHPIFSRAANPRPVVEQFPAIMRQRSAEEMAAQAWFAPDGSIRPWAPRVPFGNKVAPGGLLNDTGAYQAALQGGAGSITRVDDTSATIGVDGSAFPYAAVHRGGGDASNIDTSPVKIFPKKLSSGSRGGWAMFWALGLRFGVWLSKATLERGITIPRRPHLTDNPVLRERLSAAVASYLRGD